MTQNKYYYPPVNFWSVWFSEMMIFFLEKNGVKIKASDSVLDVGCGLGNHCFSLLEYSPKEVYGFDISNETIELLKEFNQPVNFNSVDICVDDVTSLKGKFNIIFSGDVYEHVSDPNVMLKNMAYMLKDNGCICLTFPNEEAHGHNQIYDMSVLQSQLKNAGFKFEDIEVVTSASFIYKVFTEIYILAQRFSDMLLNIKRGNDRRPESDEFHEFYAYKKIQKIKNKRFLITLINFSYLVMKKIARISKPFKGHKDYKNILNKRFILFACKA
jgi:SAM-dependent methyltransferase